MTWAYELMELAATVCEGAVMLCAVTHISCERQYGKKHKALICVFAIIYTVIISILNSVQAFSFVTICIGFTFIVLSSRFASKGSWLLCSTATVISVLVINAVDYITLFIFCMITESPVTDTYSFQVLLNPCPLRALYLTVNKGIDILLLVLLWHFLPSLQKLHYKQRLLLFCTSLSVYAIMSALIALIMSQSWEFVLVVRKFGLDISGSASTKFSTRKKRVLPFLTHILTMTSFLTVSSTCWLASKALSI